MFKIQLIYCSVLVTKYSFVNNKHFNLQTVSKQPYMYDQGQNRLPKCLLEKVASKNLCALSNEHFQYVNDVNHLFHLTVHIKPPYKNYLACLVITQKVYCSRSHFVPNIDTNTEPRNNTNI